jgi:hypothetical protein
LKMFSSVRSIFKALIMCSLIGGWRKLHNEELHNLCASPGIIRMIKSRRMRWTRHVAHMSRGGEWIQGFGEKGRRKKTTLKT